MSKDTILIFDTETTGLLPKRPSDTIPYITQLSFIVYDTKLETIRSSFNSYIRLPPEIKIPQIVTEITGITNEICEEKGIHIQEALGILFHASTLCDFIVAHNITFDIAIVNYEIQRNLGSLKHYPNIQDMFHPDRLAYYNINLDCTMRMTIEDCALIRTTDKKYTYKKFPKLSETYEFTFKKPAPANLHNSIIDVIVCLRCYLKIKYKRDITDEVFTSWITRFI